MTNILKTLLHVLSIVVICTAMAACSPMNNSDSKFTNYSNIENVQASTSIMEY